MKNLLQFTFEKNNLLYKKEKNLTCRKKKSQSPPPDIKWSVPNVEVIYPSSEVLLEIGIFFDTSQDIDKAIILYRLLKDVFVYRSKPIFSRRINFV